jgi:hypothetical protein
MAKAKRTARQSKKASKKMKPPCGVSYWIWVPNSCDPKDKTGKWRKLLDCCEGPVKPPCDGNKRFEVVLVWCRPAMKGKGQFGTGCTGHCEYDASGYQTAKYCSDVTGCECPDQIEGNDDGLGCYVMCYMDGRKKNKR